MNALFAAYSAIRAICVGLLAIFALSCTAVAAPNSVTPELHGAGSTFIQPIMMDWATNWTSKSGVKVVYDGGGSGAGITKVKAGQVDFGATDAPLGNEELAKSNLVQFPIVATVTAAVRQKFEAFNRHDVDAIERLYAANAVLHSPDYPNLSGNQPIADTYRRLFAMIPDVRDNLVLLERAGDHLYAQFELSGHLGGAQDKPVSLRLISVYIVRDNRITEDNTYYDRKM